MNRSTKATSPTNMDDNDDDEDDDFCAGGDRYFYAKDGQK